MRTLFAIALAVASTNLLAHGGHEHKKASFTSRPDGHAPIGVMGDHLHKQGEWMFSYRLMNMEMKGLLSGNDKLSDTDYQNLNQYRVRPEDMTMRMHMLGMMYAASDSYTLMVGVPYLERDMDMTMLLNGNQFDTRSSGLGDIKIGALVRLPWVNERNHRLHLNTRITLPTGSVSERDDTPMMDDVVLPYTMQLGFETWQFQGGLTYGGNSIWGNWSWGAQALFTTALENNDEGYRPGDKLEITSWLSYLITPGLSTSIRLQYADIDAIEGMDSRINSMLVSTADPQNYDVSRVRLLVGTNFLIKKGTFKNHRLAVEIGTDIYEHFEGIGMDSGLLVTVGWQTAF